MASIQDLYSKSEFAKLADNGKDKTPISADEINKLHKDDKACLLYTSPSPRDVEESRMPSSA